jgi:hypothetical protein
MPKKLYGPTMLAVLNRVAPASVEELAAETGWPMKRVINTLYWLRRTDKADSEDGLWFILDEEPDSLPRAERGNAKTHTQAQPESNGTLDTLQVGEAIINLIDGLRADNQRLRIALEGCERCLADNKVMHERIVTLHLFSKNEIRSES